MAKPRSRPKSRATSKSSGKRPAKRAPVAKVSTRSTRSIEALEAAIIEAPEQIDAYLVLADALSNAGDARGELIVAQHAARTDPRRREINVRVEELCRELDAELRALAPRAKLETTWRFGFVSHLSIDVAKLDSDPAELCVRSILDHSTTKLVSDLQLECGWAVGPSVIAATGARVRPCVRNLAIDERLDDWDDGNCTSETSALWKMLPRLDRVYLRSERALFDSISHPTMSRMSLDVMPFTIGAKWTLPALRTLEWDPHIESDCDSGVLDLVWRQQLPALRDFTVRGHLTSASLLERAGVRRFIAGLDRLCVPTSVLAEERDQLPAQLIRHASSLGHLSRLVVFAIELDQLDAAEVAEARRLLPNLQLDDTRAAAHWGEIGFEA